jgi:hypothetical protein
MNTMSDLHPLSRHTATVAAAILVILAMGTGWGFAHGSATEEFPALMALPWGLVTVIDLYSGLLLIAAWIAWRESRWPIALSWAVALFTCGNVASCVYILITYRRSRGNALEFWFGKHISPRPSKAP